MNKKIEYYEAGVEEENRHKYLYRYLVLLNGYIDFQSYCFKWPCPLGIFKQREKAEKFAAEELERCYDSTAIVSVVEIITGVKNERG